MSGNRRCARSWNVQVDIIYWYLTTINSQVYVATQLKSVQRLFMRPK